MLSTFMGETEINGAILFISITYFDIGIAPLGTERFPIYIFLLQSVYCGFRSLGIKLFFFFAHKTVQFIPQTCMCINTSPDGIAFHGIARSDYCMNLGKKPELITIFSAQDRQSDYETSDI